MILPAITLSALLFGYIARMARAGTIEALAADYTRTATLKGLPRSVVLRRHVLRNALLPTIAVIATQMSYLLGGLLVTETMFNYRGLGLLIFQAAEERDIPMLMAAVFVVGAFSMTMTLLADVLTAWLNPRVRLGART
jgi:peptide/nickel transport system permease protein